MIVYHDLLIMKNGAKMPFRLRYYKILRHSALYRAIFEGNLLVFEKALFSTVAKNCMLLYAKGFVFNYKQDKFALDLVPSCCIGVTLLLYPVHMRATTKGKEGFYGI